jgi:hypothetical protein
VRGISEHKPNFIKKIESEHKLLHNDLANIKVALKSWIESDDLLIWKIEFVWQMREFMHSLFKHFDFEEDSGVFDQITYQNAKNVNYGKIIRSEHKQILKKVNKILSGLKKNKEVKSQKLKALESEILDLIAIITKHENTEIEVIHSIYNREGTGVFRNVKEN